MNLTYFLSENGFSYNKGDESNSLPVTEKTYLEVHGNELFLVMPGEGPASEETVQSDRICEITSDNIVTVKFLVASFKSLMGKK